MAWEIRNGKRLYYRSRRQGKRVVRDYFGHGDMARLAAGLDDAKRRDRQEQRAIITTLRRQWLDACSQLDQLHLATQHLMYATLLAADVPSRPVEGDATMYANCDPVLAELMELAGRADAGDTSTVQAIQGILRDQHHIVDHFGDVARVAAELWLNLYAGGDLLIAEATRKKMVLWRASLAGPAPSPLEILLLEQITVCWLQSHYAESMLAQAIAVNASDAIVREKRRQQEDSQRRLVRGIHQLATLRKLLPRRESDPLSGAGILKAVFPDDPGPSSPGRSELR